MTLRQGLQNALKAKGLGSAVKEVTMALGVQPCGGCKKRADWLDRKFPFKRKVINRKVG
jgi:hypothetical protein